MNDLTAWAIRHGVSHVALAELRALWGDVEQQAPRLAVGTSEAAVQARTRVAVSRLGWRVWRNNVGAGKVDGQFMRWGLANDSHMLNGAIKSGDLIGIRPVLVTPQHVGQTIGQFVSLECKATGWRFTGTERETAQQKWAQLVIALGGHAQFVADERGLT